MYQTYAICYSILTILARYRQAMAYGLLFFYLSFSLLSLHFIHFSSLSFFLRHQAPFFSSFTLFSSQSRCFSLFLSDITLSFFFSLFSSFTPISIAVVFFFFFFLQWFDTRLSSGWVKMVIGGSLVVACDGQIQWWAGRLVMGSVVRNWWMGSSRPGSGTELLTSSSLARNWLSTQSSRRSGGPIGPRRWSCLGWCRWLLGWFVMGSGGMSVGFWFVGVGFGSWWCNGDVGPWLWLGIDQSKISLCLQTKTKQETHPKP